MTASDNLVSVYYFRTYEAGADSPTMSPFNATRDAIDKHFGGVVLAGTEEQVPIDAIDDLGRYVHAPSAWTELG